MEIDRRIRAKEFMQLLAVEKDKFYKLIKSGEISEPIKVSDRDIFWYSSYVKEKVEEHKPNFNMIAHN